MGVMPRPLIICILVSHQKPGFVQEAIRSVLRQTYQHWYLAVMDSGELLESGAFKDFSDPRIVIEPTHEILEMRERLCLQSRAVNMVFQASWQYKLVDDLVCVLSDDDVYAPGAFGAFAGASLAFPDQDAWFGFADVTEVLRNGKERKLGVLFHDGPGGIGGISLCGKIDGLQVCVRRKLFQQVPWPEEPEMADHADGEWLDRLGKVTTLHPLMTMIGRRRNTPLSVWNKSSDAVGCVEVQ